MKIVPKRSARMAAALQIGDREDFAAGHARARWRVEGLFGRAPVSAGRCERSPGGAEGDVEFQLPAALHRRRDLEERRNSELQTRLDGGRSGRAFHNRQRGILQQHRTHRGQSDPDRSGSEEFRNPLSLRRLSVFGAGRDARVRIYPLSQPRPEGRGQQLDDESAHAAYAARVGQRTLNVFGLLDTAAGGGSGGAGTYASNLDPDSFFGFAAKIEDFNYKFLGEKPMLAVVNAADLAGQGLPHRRRTNYLPRELGNAPALRDRSRRQAGLRDCRSTEKSQLSGLWCCPI